MNYLIEYNNKIIGVYNTFADAELFVLGNIQNNLFNYTVKILTFKSNSCYCSEIKKYYDFENEPNNIIEEINIEKKYEEKAKIQHELNLLNQEKKKIEEKKNIYENDLKLFNLFKDKSINTIPVLFKEKFNIMNTLYNNNELNIESYFAVLNTPENMDEDIELEFEIDTDSEIVS